MRRRNLTEEPGWGSSAAAVAVLVSSACCIGPLTMVLSYVGLSAGTLLAVENVVGPFRPVVLAATVVLLGVAFYGAYRPVEACDPGRSCARPASRRLQRIAAWVAGGLFTVLVYFTYVHPNLDLWFGVYL